MGGISVRRLMIVDDALFMRVSIRKMLESYDYEIVAEACDGAEAVEKYKKYRPDVITMDITMPNMTGIEALKEIKEIDKDAKVIMVSALGQEVMVKEAIISGASSFIVKPFERDKLVKVLDGVAK
ncbi:MAG: response regulator [Anaeromicrobium sp.]|jgi:two-component system chemotaxis response regulator CheY|nr:response regulator [Anaeromicrobium sp.]